MTQKVQSAVLGDAGEHLVLSKLLLQGFIAGLAPTNTKDFDLIITSQDGEFVAPIQVKTTMQKSQWRMDKKHETVINSLIYCFVRIDKTNHNPEVFIIDAKTVSYVLKRSHQIWLTLPSINKDPQTGNLKAKSDQDMRVLLTDYNKLSGLTTNKTNLEKEGKELTTILSYEQLSFLQKYSDGWMEPYRNNWSLISKK